MILIVLATSYMSALHLSDSCKPCREDTGLLEHPSCKCGESKRTESHAGPHSLKTSARSKQLKSDPSFGCNGRLISGGSRKSAEKSHTGKSKAAVETVPRLELKNMFQHLVNRKCLRRLEQRSSYYRKRHYNFFYYIFADYL